MAVTLLTVAEVKASMGGDLDETRTQSLIDDVSAIARRIEPRLRSDVPLPDYVAEGVRAVLRGAVRRALRTDDGTLQQQSETAGSFTRAQTLDTRNAGDLLTASERVDLAMLFDDSVQVGPSAASVTMAADAPLQSWWPRWGVV